ncbi:PAS domain S-box protein [Kamptonema formosum]|uniref:PAS domain S-box protein n=1 Tax=Kamptonema formosum TaxID=331992 RepID=UPI00034B878D|nr:PAS domain S-box protein [Oscillatoria sp. PCC 10802]
MLRVSPPQLRRYGLALLTVAGALALTLMLWPLLGTPVALFVAAAAFSAWYGGVGPGLLATALSALAIACCLTPALPSHSAAAGTLVELGVCGLVALATGSLRDELRAARQRAAASRSKLLERSELYRRIVETANEAIWAVDAQWRTTYVSGRMAEMFGCNPEESQSEAPTHGILTVSKECKIISYNRPFVNIWEIPEEVMAARSDAAALRAVEGKLVNPQEFLARVAYLYQHPEAESHEEIPLKDGRTLDRYSAPVKSADGAYCGRVWFFRDITRRTQLEEALRQSEKRYRSFVEQSTEGIWRFELEVPISTESPEDEQIQQCYQYAYLAECNSAMAQMYGFSSVGEIVGARVGDLLPSSDRHNLEYLRNFIRSSYRLVDAESHEFDREGNPKYFLNNLLGIVENGFLVRAWGTQRDISKRKELEEALQESERRFRSLADTAPVLIWMAGSDKLCHYLNKSWLDFTGRTLEQETGSGWTEGVHPDDLQRCLDTYTTAFDARQPFIVEYRLKRFDGEYRWILDTGTPRFTPDGSFLGYIGSCTDISHRVQAEQALRESEEKIRLIADSLPAVISYVDSQQRYVFINKTYETWFGRDRTEIIGKAIKEVLGEPAYEKICPHVEAALSGRRVTFESAISYKPGRSYYVESSYIPHLGERGEVKGFFALTSDINARKKAEEEIKKLNQDLQRRVAELQTLLDVMPIGIGIAEDAECKNIRVNPYFAKFLGISSEVNASLSAAQGEKPSNFKVCKDGRELAPEELPMQYAAAHGVEVHIEVEVVHSDGKIVNLLECAAPLFDEEGKTRGSVGAFVDITERKRTEEAQRFLASASAVLASSLDYSITLERVAQLAVPQIAEWCAVHIIEGDGSVLPVAVAHVNPAKIEWARELQRRYPYDPNQPRGVAQVLRTGKSELYPEIPDSLLLASARDAEHLEILRQVGLSSVMIVPVALHSKTLGAMSFIAAESGRRYTATDLAFAQNLADRAALAIENARLYSVAERARAAAEAANRMKDEFLATLSHELRTPLTAIFGWAKLLQAQKFDEATVQKALQTIERNAKSQSQLVEDLLDVSRIITGKLQLNVRPVELLPVIEASLDAVRPAAEAKSISLRVQLDPTAAPVCGDPERLQQVVWNLLSNAIKFTPSGGRAEVRLSVEMGDEAAISGQNNQSPIQNPKSKIQNPTSPIQNPKSKIQNPTSPIQNPKSKIQNPLPYAQIQVSDTGCGIDPDFLPHVFERFRQADSSSTRTYGGLGLGLAIVRHLVELHGGTVAASSEGAGLGATFTVRLPLAQWIAGRGAQGTGPEVPSPTPATPLSGLRVLVVDDDTDTRDLVAIALEEYGASVTAAASASEALDALAKLPPDVLVSDISMPAADGYTLMRQLRALPAERGGQVPAVALTAYARREDRQKALGAGFQIHLAKPVEPAKLAAAVASLAGRAGSLGA